MGYSYVPLKLKSEVVRIKKACILTSRILFELQKLILPGITTDFINTQCNLLLRKSGGAAGLLGFKGFPASICTSVNHVAAHGVPNSYILQEGDIITLDLTAGLDGWFGDSAITVNVGNIAQEKQNLIDTALKSTLAGIEAANAGGRMGDIGQAIVEVAERQGYTILKNYIGHGIGQDIHEEPAVLHCGEAGSGRPLVPGMVITIEPILTLGKDEVETLKDGWSVITKDRMPTAQFEHTIAIFGDHTEILTGNS